MGEDVQRSTAREKGDADSRVIDAPYGLLGGELARPLRGRTELTPRVSGRFYLQVHGQWGQDRRYTLAVRRVTPPAGQ